MKVAIELLRPMAIAAIIGRSLFAAISVAIVVTLPARNVERPIPTEQIMREIRALELSQFHSLCTDFHFAPEQLAEEDRVTAARDYFQQWLEQAAVRNDLNPLFDQGAFIYLEFAALNDILKVLTPYETEGTLVALRHKYIDLIGERMRTWKLDQYTDDTFEYLYQLRTDYPNGNKWASLFTRHIREHRRLIEEAMNAGDLEVIQTEIAKQKHLRVEDISWRARNLFELLSGYYLRALGPYFSELYETQLTDDIRQEQKQAFRRQIDLDYEDWHPLFRLMILEKLFAAHGDANHPKRRLFEFVMDWSDDKLREKRKLDYDMQFRTRVQYGLMAQAEAERRVNNFVEHNIIKESETLWDMARFAFEDRIVEILADNLSLGTEPQRRGADLFVDPIGRVAALSDRILNDRKERFSFVADHLRTESESTALAEAVHRTIDSILRDARVASLRKEERLSLLMTIFVGLQTPSAKDRLLLLFENFDRYREMYGVETNFSHYEDLLIRSHIEFIKAELRDRGGETALMVVDQWIGWIPEKLRFENVRRGDIRLSFDRLVRALSELRKGQPEILTAYLDQYYAGGMSASDPVHYERVIFHLVDILVKYAEAGRYLEHDIDAAMGRRTQEPGEPLPQHEELMELLRWLNSALANSYQNLPEIKPADLDREQRKVLETIYGFFRLRYEGAEARFEMDNPRFIETLLQLMKRVAHVANPRDIQRNILQPFEQIERWEQGYEWVDPRSKKFITADMRASISFLQTFVAKEDGQDLQPEMLQRESSGGG